ncbi:MAG: pyruvoyl-dependent arginine decarboxylase [Thermoproteota archaeon]
MTYPIIPRRIFLTKGVGKHKEKLQSFELALRDAGIEKCNLVGVSSIFPPGCKLISNEEGLQYIQAGQILFTVLCSNSTNEPNRLIAASIGLAIPQDRTMYGYLSEHTSFGETYKKAGEYAEDLAATMLATTLGIRFNINDSYDEKKQQWRISGKIVKTTNVTQSAEGDKNGLWTTVVAAAVFI